MNTFYFVSSLVDVFQCSLSIIIKKCSRVLDRIEIWLPKKFTYYSVISDIQNMIPYMFPNVYKVFSTFRRIKIHVIIIYNQTCIRLIEFLTFPLRLIIYLFIFFSFLQWKQQKEKKRTEKEIKKYKNGQNCQELVRFVITVSFTFFSPFFFSFHFSFYPLFPTPSAPLLVSFPFPHPFVLPFFPVFLFSCSTRTPRTHLRRFLVRRTIYEEPLFIRDDSSNRVLVPSTSERK